MNASSVISFGQLGLTPPDAYACMGYRGAVPEADVRQVVDGLLAELDRIVQPAYVLKILPGEVGESAVTIDGIRFDIPASIARILKGADRFAVFVVTAGKVYDDWLQEVKARGDMLSEFVADAIGSAVAEKMGAYAKVRLEEELRGARHSSSFSPGQCDWDITGQRNLFALLGGEQAGVRLNDSCLMLPVKSVSGIIGIGDGVTPGVTSCDLCPKKDCFRRHEGHS